MQNIKHQVEIGETAQALKDLADQADAAEASQAAAAEAAAYTATTPADWDGAAPTSVKEAIDRLAALIKVLNTGTGA